MRIGYRHHRAKEEHRNSNDIFEKCREFHSSE